MDATVPFPIEEAEKALGVAFRDKSLLVSALTHQSFANGRQGVADNQRLEFLGDAVIGLLAADYLYGAAPGRDEGFLTVERSMAVSGKALAAVARDLGMDGWIRFGKGVRDPSERSGDRTLAAACEAVFGAVWLDAGLDAARSLFGRLIAPSIDASLNEGVFHGDPRGELQALAHRMGLGAPVYKELSATGDGTNFSRVVSASVSGASANGCGGSKKAAAAAAAAALLAKLRPDPPGK